MAKTFLENSLNHSFWLPFYSFSFLADTFFERFSPKSLHVSILLSIFAIAKILMWSIPHKQRARIYVQARPTIFDVVGLFFCPYICRIEPRDVRPLFMWSIPHCVEMQTDRIRRFAFHVFFQPFVVDNMRVLADEEVRAAFFVPLRQTVPGGSRDKAKTLILCKQLHQFSAQLSCARWASARLRSRLGSTQRAK
jgi:hypothetical protein